MEPTFVLHTPPSPVRLTFGAPFHPYGDEDLHAFEARLTGPGLAASTSVTVARHGDQLDTYLRGLAESWRGWSGERTWRSLDSELVLDAVHDGVRRVTLGVALRYSSTLTDPDWSTRGVFSLEPGAQLSRLADDVASYLHASG